MSKYIDADELIPLLDAVIDWGKTESEKRIAHVMRNTVKSFPAADVAPVVRGEECKWFGKSRMGGGWCNEVMARPMPPDGFCSYGERKGSAE